MKFRIGFDRAASILLVFFALCIGGALLRLACVVAPSLR